MSSTVRERWGLAWVTWEDRYSHTALGPADRASLASTSRSGHWPWALGTGAPMGEGDFAASSGSLSFTASPHRGATQGFLPILSLPVNTGHWPTQYASPLQMLLGGSLWVPSGGQEQPSSRSLQPPKSKFQESPDPFSFPIVADAP